MKKERSMSETRRMGDILSYTILTIMSICWIFPIIVIILQSFKVEPGAYERNIIPKAWTIDNYKNLLRIGDPDRDNAMMKFDVWFMNTLFVAVIVCVISTFFVLAVSYTMSRLRFKMRRTFMNVALILGMFPGFMSMIATYMILKALGLEQTLTALILVYSGGTGLGFYVAKGFFDTIPKAIDEAAWIDGATKFQVFTKITMPLSKPIIVYTVLQSFSSPWMDFIFVNYVMGPKKDKYTVALGLYSMLDTNNIGRYYNQFCAGAVLVSIPLAALFVAMQKYYSEGLSGAVKG